MCMILAQCNLKTVDRLLASFHFDNGGIVNYESTAGFAKRQLNHSCLTTVDGHAVEVLP